MLRFALCVLVLTAAPALADDDVQASAEEKATIDATIARIGCKAAEVEKENDDLFEIDDAECEIGQYDIKLDGAGNIISMTRD